MVVVRGFPNWIFNPWARWIIVLALAENYSSAAAVALWKTRMLSEENRTWSSLSFRKETCLGRP